MSTRKKDMPMSDADDRQCYALQLSTGASTSDAGDTDGRRPTHVHQGIHAQASEPGSAALLVAKGITLIIQGLNFFCNTPKVYRQSREETMEGQIVSRSHRKAKKYKQVMAHLRQWSEWRMLTLPSIAGNRSYQLTLTYSDYHEPFQPWYSSGILDTQSCMSTNRWLICWMSWDCEDRFPGMCFLPTPPEYLENIPKSKRSHSKWCKLGI